MKNRLQAPLRSLFAIAAVALLALFPVAHAETGIAVTSLVQFPTAGDGHGPDGLTLGSDGNLYGTTAAGGIYDDETNARITGGTVFKVAASGAFSILHSFANDALEGADPQAAPVQGLDGNFYGTTWFGGANGNGTVYSITPEGFLTTLYNFTGNAELSGSIEPANLVRGTDGNFYGLTAGGGANSEGMFYRITPDGAFTTLLSVDGTIGRFTSLILGRDGNFHATAGFGGAHGPGAVVTITPGGTLSVLYSFTSADGNVDDTSLVQGNDGNFYGTTEYGGTHKDGMFFQLTPAGVLTTLYSFAGTDDSLRPQGLIQGNDGNFYGMTTDGGANGVGTIFAITPAGTLSTLYSFTAAESSYGTVLLQDTDGSILCATQSGGFGGDGTLFSLTTDGTKSLLHTFVGNFGVQLKSPLLPGSDGNFYGADASGGANRAGEIFQLTPAGTLTSLYSFVGNIGEGPNSGLIEGTDGNFYGTTDGAGPAGSGTIFQLTPAGALTTLYSFGSLTTQVDSMGYYHYVNADGANPTGLLQGMDGNFYGTTGTGGTGGSGTVFRLTPAGALTTLHSFDILRYVFSDITVYPPTNADGSNPGGLFQAADGNFYGTASAGGSGSGTAFEMTPAGALTVLYTFSGTDEFTYENDDGASPNAMVLGSDGNFYGTTSDGGMNADGTVFQLTPARTLTTLHDFDTTDGDEPAAGLVEGRDGNFYGTTKEGGIGSVGTIFQIKPDGTLTSLHGFDAVTKSYAPYNGDGENPAAALVQGSDGSFYGTTLLGGPGGGGTIFKFSVLLPVVTTYAGGGGTAFEGGEKGRILILRTGDTSAPLTVHYKVKGTAVAGLDYQPLSGVATIPAGADRVKIKIKPLNNDVRDGTTKVKIKLLPATDGIYVVGTPSVAAIKVIDND